jgi:hypothetical protein
LINKYQVWEFSTQQQNLNSTQSSLYAQDDGHVNILKEINRTVFSAIQLHSVTAIVRIQNLP